MGSEKVLEKASGSAAVGAATAELKVGMAIEARYRDTEDWYSGKVMAVYPAGSRKFVSKETLYDVRYDDGDTEEALRRLKIRVVGDKQRRVLEAGEEVDAVCEACEGRVYGGVVVGEAGRDVYRVEFDLEAAGVSKEVGRVRVEEEVPRASIFAMHRRVPEETATGGESGGTTAKTTAPPGTNLR